MLRRRAVAVTHERGPRAWCAHTTTHRPRACRQGHDRQAATCKVSCQRERSCACDLTSSRGRYYVKFSLARQAILSVERSPATGAAHELRNVAAVEVARTRADQKRRERPTPRTCLSQRRRTCLQRDQALLVLRKRRPGSNHVIARNAVTVPAVVIHIGHSGFWMAKPSTMQPHVTMTPKRSIESSYSLPARS